MADSAYKPKWTNFHTQAIVWVRNPFNRNVQFKVADETGVQYTYTIKANSTVELPGGAIATLGVKRLVDEMIQNDPNDILQMWIPAVRQKYESQIVVKVKEAPQAAAASGSSEITLKSVGDEEAVTDNTEDKEEDEAPVYPTKRRRGSKPKVQLETSGQDQIVEE